MLKAEREQSKGMQTTRVRWRWWIGLALLTLILLLLAVLPGVPVVREWLLGYATHYVERAGYSLDYRSSSGNMWSGFKLEGLYLQGQGQDVALQSLSVGYFLPALITGDLPLSIAAQGLSGDINFKTLAVGTSLTPAEENVLPIRIKLKDVDLSDIALQARDVPFTLPNFSLGNLQIESRGELLHFVTMVSTPEGSADAEGDLQLSPFALNVDVSRADVTIARQWWDGIEAGQTSGRVWVENGRVWAEARVTEGQIRFMNEVVNGIQGTATLDFPKVRANLEGKTLGGTVQATGGVDIDQYNWFADFTGDVDLKKAAVWLATERLPFALEPWPLEGRAQTTVQASGWTAVSLQGQAAAEGTLATLPLNIQESTFSLDRSGVNVTATGTLAEGPLTASFKPEDQGLVFEVDLQQAQVLPFAKADGSLMIRSQGGVTQGESNVALGGRLWGREFDLNAEGLINQDGWQNFITGMTSLGEPIDGAVVLNQDLKGQINIQQVRVPGASELLELNLAVSGPPTSLPLTLTLTGPERFDYAVAGVTFPVQGGKVSGILEIPEVKNIQGNLGPIQMQGQLSLIGPTVELAFRADDIPLSGRLETRLDIPEGRFKLQEGIPSAEFQLQTTEVTTSGLTLAPITGEANISLADGLSATLKSPMLDVTFQQGDVTAKFNDAQVTVANQDLTLNGSAQVRLEDLGTLSADIRASSSLAEVTLQGQNGQLAFEATRQDEFPFDMQGNLDVLRNSIEFSGTLMDTSVQGTASLQEVLNAEILLESGDKALTVTVTGPPTDPELNAKGSLDVEALRPVLNIPLSGAVQLDMTRRAGAFSGSASLEGTANDIPVDVKLIGQGNTLVLEGTATPLGQFLDLTGNIDLFAEQPELTIKAQGDIGSFELNRDAAGFQLSGQGVTPEVSAGGFKLEGQPWELRGPLDNLSLTVGGSEVVIKQADGLSASGKIAQVFTFRGIELLLKADTIITPERSLVEGILTVTTPTQQAVLPVSGSLDALNIQGTVAAQEIAALAKLPLQLAGDIQVGGTVSLLEAQPAYIFSGNWQAGGAALPFDIAGQGSNFEVSTNTETLTARYSPEGLELSANAFDPGPFLLSPRLSGLATGQLNYLNQQWSGQMQYASREPVPANLSLKGSGEMLELDINYENQGVLMSVTGQVLPALSLDVQGSYRDLAFLSGRLSIADTQPVFNGMLRTAVYRQSALGVVIPEQQFAVSNDGLKLVLSNEGSRLAVDQKDLEGNLQLVLGIKEQMHTLDVILSGPLHDISATAQLSGEVLRGSLGLNQNVLSANVLLNPEPYLKDLAMPLPLRSGPLHITVRGDTSNWQAEVLGQGELDKLPLDLSASVAGQGLNYQADAGLRINGQVLPFKILGQAGDIQVQADFDYFPLSTLAPYVQSEGQMRGYVRYDNTQAQPLEMQLAASGQVANQDFELNAVLGPSQSLSINLSQGKASVLIEPKSAKDYAFTVALPELAYPLLLKGDASIADVITLEAQGQLASEAIVLEARLNPDTFQANWFVDMDASSFQGTLENVNEVLTLQSRLELVPNSLLAIPVNATLHATSVNGQWTMEALDVETSFASASLSGLAFPQTDVSGSLAFAPLGPVQVRLRREEGYLLDLSQNGLQLSSVWSSLTRLESARLSGAGALAEFGSAAGELSWRRWYGFSGTLDLELKPNQQLPLVMQIKALGQGSLELSAQGLFEDMQVANIGLTVAADASTVLGRTTVKLDLAELYNLGSPLLLSGDIDLSGSLLEVGAIGPVNFSGLFNAEGQLTATNVLREGSLELSGDIDVLARYHAGGYEVNASTKQLDISSFLPQFRQPLLTGNLHIASSPEGKPLLQSDMTFELENSLLAGTLSYDQGWQGNLNVDASLADVSLNLPLQGILKGDIALNSTLRGNLVVSGLNWGQKGSYLDGNIVLAGTLAAPSLQANLTGSGQARGTLVVNIADQSLRLRSTLAAETFSTDVDLMWQRDNVQGQGSLLVAGYKLSLEASDSMLKVVGQDQLLGWQLDVNVMQKHLVLRGDLSSLNQALKGQVQLSYQENGLSGNLQNIVLGNLALGHADINSRGSLIAISGDSILAQLDVEQQSWVLEDLYLKTGEISVNASGTGTLSTATLEASVQGALLGEPLEIPLSLIYADQHLQVQSQATLPQGYLEILAQATPQTGWQGSVKMRTTLKGVQADMDGTLSGPLMYPEIVASNVLTHEVFQVAGTLKAGFSGVSLEQNLISPQLNHELFVQGQLFPLNVKLSSSGQVLELRQQDQLFASGQLTLLWNRFNLKLTGQEARLAIALGLPLPGFTLMTTFDDLSLRGLQEALQGLTLQGQDRTSGSVFMALAEGLTVQLEDFKYETAYGRLELDGGLRQQRNWQGQLTGTFQGFGGKTQWLPWLSSLNRVDINFILEEQDVALIMQSEAGGLQARLKRDTAEGELKASAQLGIGRLSAYVGYNQLGPLGEIRLENIPLYQDLNLSSVLNLDSVAMSGQAEVQLGAGQLRLEGSLGLASLLPPALVPQGSLSQRLNVRMDNVDIQDLPYLKNRLPYVDSKLSLVARLQDGRWVGQISSPLQVVNNAFPLSLEFNGPLTALELRGTLGRSNFNASLDGSHIEGLLSFDQFPLESVVEAVVGETGVQGVLWGALRFDFPWRRLGQGYLSFASENLVLGQGETETRGQLSFRLQKGELVIDRARFEGEGNWEATGQVTSEVLNLSLSARDADFTPILQLVPQLASIGFGAQGSFELSTSGSLAEPQAKLISPVLGIQIGGSSYRLQETLVDLRKGRLTAQSQLIGLKPIGGSLTVLSQGQVQLSPLQASIDFKTSGSLNVPALGQVESIDATITRADVPWQLDLKGRLGQPFSIQGSLFPLDLRLQGQDLNLRAPERFLDSSQADVDMRLRYEQGLVLSGAILADNVSLKLVSGETKTASDPVLVTPNRFLEHVIFEDIRVQAQQIHFEENFGAGDLRADLILSSTAAQPQLSGQAQSLRGSLNFSGRRFNVDRAVAEFQPSRGIYPSLVISATTSLEKSAALRGSRDISFEMPEGSSFSVFLTFTGELLPKPGGGFSADLDPKLSSDAIIATPLGQRALTENELFSLITLGNLQLAETITGEGSVAESVAQGALDTAIDYFILSELQTQLGQVLGVDVFEVRTTALSSLIAGTDAFGVAVRIGGYLDDELFASYEIRTLDLEPDVAFTNEFSLRYDFSPLELDLTGRLNILREASFTPVPELSLGVGYIVSPLLRIQGSVDVSQKEQSVRFGISLRW